MRSRIYSLHSLSNRYDVILIIVPAITVDNGVTDKSVTNVTDAAIILLMVKVVVKVMKVEMVVLLVWKNFR